MNTQLKSKIKSIEPEFHTDESHFYKPLPNRVSLYLYNDDYLIDLSLEDEILRTDIWVYDKEVKLTNEDVKFIYEYLNELLDYQIELTKMYYEAEQHEDELIWYIG
jgi:hypothetical protein